MVFIYGIEAVNNCQVANNDQCWMLLDGSWRINGGNPYGYTYGQHWSTTSKYRG